MINLMITPATSEDLTAVANLKARVWPAEAPVVDRIGQVLAQPDHRVHAARAADGTLAGFVDGFLTQAADGSLRWEVDLLAVDPVYQGQKIGQQLIAASIQAGRDAGAGLARALIQVENFASQGAFRRSGFHASGQIYRLLVSDQGASPAQVTKPYLIAVTTMNYSGLWLEGDVTTTHLAAAEIERARLGCDLVGVLLPLRATDLLVEARWLGYRTVEHFHWWTLALDGS
jgi:ribosomal protein S18 acetylase RimI-like enzyme